MGNLTHWTVERVKLADVEPLEDNPRSIKSKNLSALEASMKRFGYVDLIIWNRRTGHIVGGHQRYSVLVDEGVEEADMVVVDMDEEEERAANLTLNNPEVEGDWDESANDLIAEIERNDPEFYKSGNFEDLRKTLEKQMPSNDDDDTDTECPCCGHRWRISENDVSVMTDEQQTMAGLQAE